MEKLHIQNQYIGTHRDIVCFVEEERYQIISDYIDNLMKEFESNFSRFRKDSLLSMLNEKRVLINSNKDLLAMLQIGELYRTLSGGYFSVFVGSDLENLGYGWSNLLKWSVIDNADSKLMFDEQKITLVWYKNVDLWWIGKWYLIQLIQEYFESQCINLYYINGWGDIAISQDTIDYFGPILLQHPLHEDEYFASIPLLHGSLAWSGNMYRKWKNSEWEIIWHLIDPHTGKPAHTGIISTHVYHESPLVADILATTFFVMPMDGIEDLAKMLGAEYCVVLEDLTLVKSIWFPWW